MYEIGIVGTLNMGYPLLLDQGEAVRPLWLCIASRLPGGQPNLELGGTICGLRPTRARFLGQAGVTTSPIEGSNQQLQPYVWIPTGGT
jgi:hypothetical protein